LLNETVQAADTVESHFLEPTREHLFRLVEKTIVQKVMVNFPCLSEGEETAFGSIKLSEVSEKLSSTVYGMIIPEAERLSEK